MLACRSKGADKTALLLIEAGDNVDHQQNKKRQNTPLIWATKNAMVEVVRVLAPKVKNIKVKN
jgi:hypothetical protein